LSTKFETALAEIDLNMKHISPDYMINRCKQRLLRLRETLVRMRKLQLNPRKKLVGVKSKTEKRESAREKWAEEAAKLDNAIEDELLQRLRQGTYGEIYNYGKEQDVEMGADPTADVDEADADSTDESDSERLAEAEEKGEIEFIEDDDVDFSDDSDLEDYEDDFEKPAVESIRETRKPLDTSQLLPKRSRGVRVEIEYDRDEDREMA